MPFRAFFGRHTPFVSARTVGGGVTGHRPARVLDYDRQSPGPCVRLLFPFAAVLLGVGTCCCRGDPSSFGIPQGTFPPAMFEGDECAGLDGACDAGLGAACHDAGVMFANGEGVATDATTAGGYFTRGCALGYSESCVYAR